MKDLLVFDFANRKGVPATNLSEGTLLVLGLLAVLHSPSRPKVILLDDIEKGLHPRHRKILSECSGIFWHSVPIYRLWQPRIPHFF